MQVHLNQRKRKDQNGSYRYLTAKIIPLSFLIVTHHRLTMAKMNKLLGVTMEEKGISKLLSVDLEKAVEIKEAS